MDQAGFEATPSLVLEGVESLKEQILNALLVDMRSSFNNSLNKLLVSIPGGGCTGWRWA